MVDGNENGVLLHLNFSRTVYLPFRIILSMLLPKLVYRDTFSKTLYEQLGLLIICSNIKLKLAEVFFRNKITIKNTDSTHVDESTK